MSNLIRARLFASPILNTSFSPIEAKSLFLKFLDSHEPQIGAKVFSLSVYQTKEKDFYHAFLDFGSDEANLKAKNLLHTQIPFPEYDNRVLFVHDREQQQQPRYFNQERLQYQDSNQNRNQTLAPYSNINNNNKNDNNNIAELVKKNLLILYTNTTTQNTENTESKNGNTSTKAIAVADTSKKISTKETIVDDGDESMDFEDKNTRCPLCMFWFSPTLYRLHMAECESRQRNSASYALSYARCENCEEYITQFTLNQIRVAPCNHLYCVRCYTQLTHDEKPCPSCQQPLPSMRVADGRLKLKFDRIRD